MSGENVDVIRRGYEEYAAGRLADYIARVADPDFELDMTRWGPAAYTYRGDRRIQELPAGARHALGALRHPTGPIRGGGDHVVVVIQVEARGRGSGAEVSAQYANTWTFRDGRVIRAEWVDEPAEALQAVGPPE